MNTEQTELTPVQVDFTLEIGRGKMDISAIVPKEEINLVQLLPSLKQLSSNVVNALADSVEKEGYRISCKAGCGACCRQLVPLTLFEAEELTKWILSLPEEQQRALEQRFHEALVKLKASGVLDRLDLSEMPDPRSEKALNLALDYLKVGAPCPFLENESCSIHPIRPIICREYLVVSPAEFCANPTKETVKPIPMPVRISGALTHMGAAITPEKQGWLPLTFLFGFIRSDTHVADAYRGTGPELLRRVIERIAVSEPGTTETPASQN